MRISLQLNSYTKPMKKMLLILAMLPFVSLVAQSPLQVMTFNLRLNIASDSLNAWPYRKDHAALQIRFYEATSVGVQEALHDQLVDLQERLPGYAYIGGGRDDGKTKGEASAIFYD